MSFGISSNVQYNIATALATFLNSSGLVMKIYGDATSQAAADALIPTTRDAAIGSATLLCTISVDGDGTVLSFDTTPVNGAIYKTSTETWVGTNVASGYPSFYRMETAADDGSLSTSAPRLQGTVGQLNADLIIAATYLVSGQEQRVDSYLVGIPVE